MFLCGAGFRWLHAISRSLLSHQFYFLFQILLKFQFLLCKQCNIMNGINHLGKGRELLVCLPKLFSSVFRIQCAARVLQVGPRLTSFRLFCFIFFWTRRFLYSTYLLPFATYLTFRGRLVAKILSMAGGATLPSNGHGPTSLSLSSNSRGIINVTSLVAGWIRHVAGR
jgi:hypothetical protein